MNKVESNQSPVAAPKWYNYFKESVCKRCGVTIRVTKTTKRMWENAAIKGPNFVDTTPDELDALGIKRDKPYKVIYDATIKCESCR